MIIHKYLVSVNTCQGGFYGQQEKEKENVRFVECLTLNCSVFSLQIKTISFLFLIFFNNLSELEKQFKCLTCINLDEK